MSREQFGGVDFKLAEAAFFFERMDKELVPPRFRPENQAARLLQGSVMRHGTRACHDHHPWQQSFYFFLDGFLMATRSVPDIVQKWFGHDSRGDSWFKALPAEEQARRKTFQEKFRPLYNAFSNLPASKARVVTVHGRGTPPVRVRITGMWGRLYEGRPGVTIPTSEIRHVNRADDEMTQWWISQSPPMPLDPKPDDFALEVQQGDGGAVSIPLFQACQAYLREARKLVMQAEELDQETHAGQPLTEPPMS
jgi:hypothetical protein